MRKYLFLCLCLLLAQLAKGQDIHFTQYFNAAPWLNPAKAGLMEADGQAGLNYRQQWASVPVPYSTFMGHAAFRLHPHSNPQDGFTLGLNIAHDVAGDGLLSWTQLGATAAYSKKIALHTLSAGAQVGGVQRRINPEKLSFDNQWNGDIYQANLPSRERIEQTSFLFEDISAGFSWRFLTPKGLGVELGASAWHLSKPQQRFFNNTNAPVLPIRMSISAEGAIPLGAKTWLKPSVLFMQQGAYQQWNTGLLGMYAIDQRPGRQTYFSLGSGYRFQDAAWAYMGLAVGQWQGGLSYDINTSDFSRATNSQGGFELSLLYRWKSVPVGADAKVCPVF